VPGIEAGRPADGLVTIWPPTCFRTDLDKLAVEASITLPHIDATADYDVDGRILVASFKGKGVFKGNFSE
jgi:hypothetical protein